MMKRLEPVILEAAAPKVTGRPPQLEVIPVAKLCIDPTYQRDITSRGIKTIRLICQKFDWKRFSPLIVAKVENDRYAVIDGQHRATAAITLGITEVPCAIVEATSHEQAAIFSSINGTVTPMSILSLYKAGLASGEVWAKEIEQVGNEAGIKVHVYPVPASKMGSFETLAVGTLRDRIKRHGTEVLTQALRLEKKHPGAEAPGYFNSRAIDVALTRYRDKPNRDMAEGKRKELMGRIRELKRRGYSRQAIVVAVKCSYADIEEALQ